MIPQNFPVTLSSKFGKVKIYRWLDKSVHRYTVTWNHNKKRHRNTFTVWDEAESRASEILNDIRQGRTERSHTDTEKFMYYRMCETLLGGVPLLDAVKFYIEQNKFQFHPRPVAEIAAEFLQAQETRCLGKTGDVHTRNIRTIRHHLNKLNAALGKRMMKDVTADDLDEYFASISACGRTRINHRRTCIALWRWASDRQYLPQGKTAAQLTVSPKADPRNPAVIKPDVMYKMLQKVSDSALPFLILGGYAGVRSAEIARMNWEDFNWDEGYIKLSSEITKRERRRMVPIGKTIRHYLEKFKGATGPVLTGNPYSEIKNLSKEFGAWVHNGLRHSFISYSMALHKNAAMVADWCGNSESEVQRSYKALVTEKEAKLWFFLENY